MGIIVLVRWNVGSVCVWPGIACLQCGSKCLASLGEVCVAVLRFASTHTDPRGCRQSLELDAFVRDSVSVTFQNGTIMCRRLQSASCESWKLMNRVRRGKAEDECRLILSFKSMVKTHKNDSANNCHADRTMSPLSLFRHIANGKTVQLPATVVCTPKLYKVLCQHFPLFQIPPKSLRNPPHCIAHCL